MSSHIERNAIHYSRPDPNLCSKATMRWQGALVWGLAGGIGFGAAEGIIYAGDFYNGMSTGGVYLVRFVSCVALHAVWSGAVAISVYNRRGLFEREEDWSDFLLSLILILAVPMLLHGLYDTLLKRDLTAAALVVAVASFGWLALLIERARRGE